MAEIKGFTVVPVIIPPTPYYKQQTHYMFIKRHTSNDPQLSQRSLFILNPPLNTTLTYIKKFIQSISTNLLIEQWFINEESLDYDINLTKLTSDLYDEENQVKLPNGTGVLVFVDKDACTLALSKLKKYVKGKERFSWEMEHGSIKMVESYRAMRLPIEHTSELVTRALQDFEQREAESMEKLQDIQIVDEDGFTMVVGKNRKTKRGILGKISGTQKIKQQEENKLKKKEKQDFYRFQIREKKKLEMNELLKKFKDDQERIKELKEKKRFRPY
jgi:ribosomal RNA-processing protein 7